MPVIVTVQDMEKALVRAEPRGPSGLPEPDPGAVLALACHCVMVDNGFVLSRPGGEDPSNRWAPQPKWATELKDEWVFRYSMPGKRNSLVLHCSLQRVSERMLVHTIEINNERNSHLLGLLLSKYAPDSTILRSRSWEGVLQNTDVLSSMMQEHVLAPLLLNAEDVPAAAVGTGESWSAGNAGARRTWLQRMKNPLRAAGEAEGGSFVLPAVVLTAVAVVGVGVYVASKRNR